MSLLSGELIGVGDEIGAVGVSFEVYIPYHGQQLCRMAAGTQHNEEVCLLARVTRCASGPLTEVVGFEELCIALV